MTALLVHLEEEWIELDGLQARALPSYPGVEQAALVVTDFGPDTVSGVTQFEGNPIHAPALINRQLLTQGATDGESHVMIHTLDKVASGYMVSYSAVALARWQRLEAWSRKQSRACLIVPLLAMAWRRVGPMRGVAVQSGRNLIFVARAGKRLLQCSTLAFSDEGADLQTAARALGERVRVELSEAGVDIETFEIEWHTVFGRLALSDDPDRHRELARTFFEQASVKATIVPTHTHWTERWRIDSTLLTLLDARSFLMSVNPLNQRVSWGLERWAVGWCALFCVIALGGLLYATSQFVQTRSLVQQTHQIEEETRQLQARYQALVPQTIMPAQYEAWSKQLITQYETSQRFDVSGMIRLIGAAAQSSGVRVLRIYTVNLTPKDRGAARTRAAAPNKALIVDGALSDASDGSYVDKLARFVYGLREQGLAATPIDTAAQHVDGNLLAQVFTYRLTPIQGGEQRE
ncbi:hypothetical protein LGM43_35595 [Burkholderia seminalis]|uniref:hypothetical protein n=1 Tax=Burkholderia seminalis TaxID=488731 RepID=UPI001CF5C670|nr:hypothetical protein [Burkholderia seminalis]MCA7955582.1 hypothetical protein [Burkholderia seminalis]